MQYRTARVEDAPQLAEINRQLIEEEWGGGGMSLQRLEDRMRRWLSDGEHRGYLFLEDGETVAYALLAMDEESAYIRHFFVLHEHRGAHVRGDRVALRSTASVVAAEGPMAGIPRQPGDSKRRVRSIMLGRPRF